MKIKKGFTVIELLVAMAIIGILATVVLKATTAHACGFFTDCAPTKEIQTAADIQNRVTNSVPIPQIETSVERINVAHRATIFNDESKISYIYLVSFGKVMAFYTVKGKVSSLRSYIVPTDKLVRWDGSPCSSLASPNCWSVDAPDIDGTYGENVSGIFFFTTDGVYVEWNGDYMMSDQPLKLTTQPELVREIK